MILFNQPISIQRKFIELLALDIDTVIPLVRYDTASDDEVEDYVHRLLNDRFNLYKEEFNTTKDEMALLSIYIQITSIVLVFEQAFESIKPSEEQLLLKEVVKFTPYEILN